VAGATWWLMLRGSLWAARLVVIRINLGPVRKPETSV
jgi:hypothetical protein